MMSYLERLILKTANALPYQVLPVGTRVPNLTMETIIGTEAMLSAETSTLVVFMSTQCSGCVRTIPQLHAILAKKPELRVRVIFLNCTREEALKWCDTHSILFEVGFDADGGIAKEYGVKRKPTTYVVSPIGNIRYCRVGMLLPENVDEILSMML